MSHQENLSLGHRFLADSPLDTIRQSRRLSLWARVVLIPVAGIGAVLSFRSLYLAAQPTFGSVLAAGFPALVDLLILGSSLQYVAGAKLGHPVGGWRLTAHAGVAATLALNAMAARHLNEVPWHITAPAVWAVLVELTAKQVIGQWKHVPTLRNSRISIALWITAPREALKTKVMMHRTGITDAHTARVAVERIAAAREVVRLTLPPDHRRRTRTLIYRQLRTGSLAPTDVLPSLGWDEDGPQLSDNRTEAAMLAAILQRVLVPSNSAVPTRPEPADAANGQRHEDETSQQHFHLDSRPHGDRDTSEPDRRPVPDNGEGTQPDGPGSLSQNHLRRLDDAIQIVRLNPEVTGRSLAAALRRQGWPVSDRTASRVLPEARRLASDSIPATT